MIRIDVVEQVTAEKIVPYKGKDLKFHEQTAWAHFVGANGQTDAHPTKIIISHDKPEQAYKPGSYTLTPDSLYAGSYGRVGLRIKLKPVAAAAVKTA